MFSTDEKGRLLLMEKKKKLESPRKVWPFLTGKPIDGRTPMAAFKFFLASLAMLVAFLIVGAMMMWNNFILRAVSNGVLLLGAYVIFWQSGVAAGTDAVNLGEMLYQRQATGRDHDLSELPRSYHPAKGYLTALFGSIPLFLCAVALALTAQRVMVGAGTLPSWLASLERREEIGQALISYHQGETMTGTDVLRLIIRMAIMPVVNIIGGENKEGLLLAERLSPLLVLLPAVFYGVGYTGGVKVRTKIHADIEAGKRKLKRRQKRERNQRTGGNRGPGQLN